MEQIVTATTRDEEVYLRLLFRELLRVQADTWHEEEPGFLSAFSFWQYANLPSVLSDALFRVLRSRRGWNGADFFSFHALLLHGTEHERLAFFERMADFDEDRFISLEDVQTLLIHSLASPLVSL